MYRMYVDLASIKNKKEYDLIQMWGLKVEGLLMIKSIEEIVFILMAQDNVSSRWLLWINGWDQNASFKRLLKRRLGVRKETNNDQVQRILRDKNNFILKGIIHSKRLVNQDWISLLISMWYKRIWSFMWCKDEELEFGKAFRGTKLGEGQLGCAEGPILGRRNVLWIQLEES